MLVANCWYEYVSTHRNMKSSQSCVLHFRKESPCTFRLLFLLMVDAFVLYVASEFTMRAQTTMERSQNGRAESQTKSLSRMGYDENETANGGKGLQKKIGATAAKRCKQQKKRRKFVKACFSCPACVYLNILNKLQLHDLVVCEIFARAFAVYNRYIQRMPTER